VSNINVEELSYDFIFANILDIINHVS